MKPIVEWALVADAQRCRILQREAPLGRWRELEEEALEIANPRTHEQGTDRPGRVQDSAGSARHAVEPRVDAHRKAKQDFARRLTERLEASSGRYDRLLLVAPPAFLGDLREELGEAARKRLIGSLDRDLTRHALAELVPHLDEIRPA